MKYAVVGKIESDPKPIKLIIDAPNKEKAEFIATNKYSFTEITAVMEKEKYKAKSVYLGPTLKEVSKVARGSIGLGRII